MSQFTETDHPRAADGRFASKAHAEAADGLAALHQPTPEARARAIVDASPLAKSTVMRASRFSTQDDGAPALIVAQPRRAAEAKGHHVERKPAVLLGPDGEPQVWMDGERENGLREHDTWAAIAGGTCDVEQARAIVRRALMDQAAATRHENHVYGPDGDETIEVVNGLGVVRARYIVGCDYCDGEREHGNTLFPPHTPSKACASGGAQHCTCPACF